MNAAQTRTRVVVVDDDPRLRELLSRYLDEQGFAVRTVHDGVGLDRLLQREVADVLVLDLTLPGEDGLAICRRLRAAGSELGIVMLTARGDEVDRIVGLEIGADDYLPKPFNPRELVARINAVLRRRAPGRNRPSCFVQFAASVETTLAGCADGLSSADDASSAT